MDAGAYREFADQEERHWWFIGRRNIFRHVVARTLRGPESATPQRILDLGCGMGGMLSDLSLHGDVFGADVARDALQHCRERGHRRVLRCFGEGLPFLDGVFDLVTAFDAIEHIPDDRGTLSECFRILRPGGHIVLSVPAHQWLYSHQDRLVDHQRRYNADVLAERLERAGFRVQRLSYFNFLLFPLILPIVLLLKLKERVRPPAPNSYASNVSIPLPDVVHRILARIMGFERHLVAALNVPTGHSLLAVARKPHRGG